MVIVPTRKKFSGMKKFCATSNCEENYGNEEPVARNFMVYFEAFARNLK